MGFVLFEKAACLDKLTVFVYYAPSEMGDPVEP